MNAVDSPNGCVCRGRGPGSWNHAWGSACQITIVQETPLGTNRRGRRSYLRRLTVAARGPLQGANETKNPEVK